MPSQIKCRGVLLVLVGLLVITGVVAAMAKDRPETKVIELERLSEALEAQVNARRPQPYYDLLNSTNPVQQKFNVSPNISLMFLDERDHPVYYIVNNINAARTLSTDDVWPGGSAGFDLTGGATTLGELAVWDGGGVRTTHVEFGGRATQMDGASTTNFHATHVAGTMIASGVSATAQGMSIAAQLAAYDWFSDNAEMAAAAANGMHLSNHSYGWATGWRWDGDWYWYGDASVSETEDYGFGFYGSDVRTWDEIAYNAPYYTIVTSAGNDRDDDGPSDPQDGHYYYDGGDWVLSYTYRQADGHSSGYDCIPWHGNAKNVVTVGAVSDLSSGWSSPNTVSITSFSSWGPTDDGRIKPDIVGNGTSLRSTDNGSDTDYLTISGTSMSSPNITRSLNLCVRYYEATHDGETPLSATVKALMIQTADEAGTAPGPDYKFGWGLMNTRKTIETIQADSIAPGIIREEQLADSELHEWKLLSDGTEPIQVTIAWTDPPGTVPTASVDPPDLILVNDLDLRIVHELSGSTYEPYVLNPAIPANGATTGDNFRDNVEQVHIEQPEAGLYFVRVSHKGTLANPQDYSLVGSERMYICDCPMYGDLNLDGSIDPLDVSFIVNYVFKDLDAIEQIITCPAPNGDWNCDGSIDPVDVALYVNYVFQDLGAPCDPCTL